MNDLNSLLSDESFQRWLQDGATPDEAANWQAWLQEHADNQQVYKEAKYLWERVRFEGTRPPDVDREWRRLHSKLGLAGRERSQASLPARGQSYPSHRGRAGYSSRRWLGGVVFASIILFSVLKYTGFFPADKYSEGAYQELATEFGQRVTLTFPDETKVILNANSKLRYPAVWTSDENCTVFLEGEAYFDVAPQTQPGDKFMIRTADGTVSVIGTEFAVYERGNGTRVVVREGKVGVTAMDTSGVATQTPAGVLLQPGQLLRFNRGISELRPSRVAVEPYVTWWQTQLVFVETPFEEIAQRIEETYGVEVKVSDDKLLERTLSGSIENQNLVVVTDAIAEALKVSVTRDGHIIMFGKRTR